VISGWTVQAEIFNSFPTLAADDAMARGHEPIGPWSYRFRATSRNRPCQPDTIHDGTPQSWKSFARL
jgi:hypothetical protein